MTSSANIASSFVHLYVNIGGNLASFFPIMSETDYSCINKLKLTMNDLLMSTLVMFPFKKCLQKKSFTVVSLL